jgi:hypothetical protein
MGSVSGVYLLEHVQKTVVFTIECDALPQTQLTMGVGCITGYMLGMRAGIIEFFQYTVGYFGEKQT